MKKYVWVLIPLLILMTMACAKRVQAPIPGQISSFDGYAYRTIYDMQATLNGAKAWETCSDQKYPASVTFDGKTFTCSDYKGQFPANVRSTLYKAEQSYNVAQDGWKTYHSGASNDTAGLQQAINALVADVTSLVAQTGGK